MNAIVRCGVRPACVATAFVLGLAAFGAVTLRGQQAPATPSGSVPGELLVKYRPGAPAAARARARAGAGAALVDRFEALDIDLVRVAAGREPGTLASLQADADVLIAEPNYVRQAVATVPTNDPYWLADQLWGLQRILAQSAWLNFPVSGAPVVVADIDTGVNYTHPDLAANMWQNPWEIPGNGIDDDANGYVDDVYGIDAINHDSDPMDDNGHGTHTAGTIAAVGNNGVGVVGVNLNAKILACKFLDAAGNGSDSGAIACFNYVAALRARGVNVRVTSNSWGGYRSGPATLLENAIDTLGAAGVVNVFAAGNNGTNNDTAPFDPASLTSSSIVAVAASDGGDNRAGFSNYGATSVDLAAPGVSILSTYGGGYAYLSGTSMATPHVAGAASMIAALRPNVSVAGLKSILLDNTDHLGNWNGVVASGGRLNLFNSSLAAYVNVAPTTSISAPVANANLAVNVPATLAAAANDADGVVASVTFLIDGVALTTDTTSPYSASWTPTVSGPHVLTVIAADNLGAITTSAAISVTVVSQPSTASFLRVDAVTKGSWLGSYGSQGHMLAANATSLPAWAQVTVNGQLTHTWASSTSDPRGLQRPSDGSRTGATWYQGSSFQVDIHITDGASHQIAAYAVDWDSNGARAQRFEVLDATTGAVLDTRLLASFQGGQYLVWTLSGHVVLRVTNTGTPNAVMSAMFFGPGATSTTATASFVAEDTASQGTWLGRYGAQGYMLAGEASSVPGYAAVSLLGASTHTWTSNTADMRGLQRPDGNSRLASTWFGGSFTLDVNFTDGNTHQVALYVLDWDAANARGERIDVLDATSWAVLDTRTVSAFASGQYVIWNIGGHVTLRITNAGSPNAVVGGIFFGGGGAAPTAATFVRTDTATQGSWQAVYGSQGYILAADATNLPSFAGVTISGQPPLHTWAASTSELRGLQRASSASRFAATWFSGTTFQFDVQLSDGAPHQVSMYLMDWDSGGTRAERIDIFDAATGALLDTRTASGFANGVYLVWTLSGHVTMRITNSGSPNAVVSGLFF